MGMEHACFPRLRLHYRYDKTLFSEASKNQAIDTQQVRQSSQSAVSGTELPPPPPLNIDRVSLSDVGDIAGQSSLNPLSGDLPSTGAYVRVFLRLKSALSPWNKAEFCSS